MALPASSGERHAIGLLWDGDETVPPAVLAERLAHLKMLSASTAYTGPRALCVPPVLLVTTYGDRVPLGYRPGLLWTTQAEIARHGVLDAPWRGSDLGEPMLPLSAALAGRDARPADAMLGVPVTRGGALRTSQARGRHRRLQQRITALRDGACPSEDLALLALAVPPRGFQILAIVGQHPLLRATEIAVACALNPVDVWSLLGLLRRHGLAAGWTPPGKSRKARYVLSARGLRLLAMQAGLEPAAYRRIHAALDNTAGRARKGLRFAQRNLAHTEGINHAYLALFAAARTTGAALDWRGEWACAQRYLDRPHLRTLHPDAEARYTWPGGQQLFVEVDRGTKRLRPLAAKLAQYATYRGDSGRDQVTVLLVTTGYERGWELLHLNETLPEREEMPPLDLLVTTRAEIADGGAQARIWRATSGPCATLLSYLNMLATQVS